MIQSTTVQRYLVLLGCLLASLFLTSCGKKGHPTPEDHTGGFDFAYVTADISNDCLSINGTLKGKITNLGRMRIEVGSLDGTDDDCIGCPFIPSEVVVLGKNEIHLDQDTGDFAFSYCPQKAQGYRWRIAGISVFSNSPHTVSPEYILIKQKTK